MRWAKEKVVDVDNQVPVAAQRSLPAVSLPITVDACVLKQIAKHNQGFTLIELMIVIAILAVLMAIAVPTYATFVTKAKVSECLHNAAPMKTSISEVAMTMNTGSFPADATAALIDPASMANLDYCEAGSYANTGALTLQVDEAALGVGGTIEMLLVPSFSGTGTGSIIWDCQPGATSGDAMRYLPAGCRI